jgi:hypothetical protein
VASILLDNQQKCAVWLKVDPEYGALPTRAPVGDSTNKKTGDDYVVQAIEQK